MEREEIERQADAICAMYDEDYFAVMNRILEEVREDPNNPHTSTLESLGRQALTALGLPKIP